MELSQLGKWIFYIGIVLCFIGFLIWLGSKIGIPFGKLPGDIRWNRDHFSVYIPIVTSIAVSIILTIVLNLVFWLIRK